MRAYSLRVLAIAGALIFGLPVFALGVGVIMFAFIGWLPALLALSAGEWVWGGGMFVGWAFCVAAVSALQEAA